MLRLQGREVDKFLMSGIMNVALVQPLLPNSLKAISKQTRLNISENGAKHYALVR